MTDRSSPHPFPPGPPPYVDIDVWGGGSPSGSRDVPCQGRGRFVQDFHARVGEDWKPCNRTVSTPSEGGRGRRRTLRNAPRRTWKKRITSNGTGVRQRARPKRRGMDVGRGTSGFQSDRNKARNRRVPPQEMGETNAGVAVDVPAPFARTTKDRNWQRMTEVDVCGFVRRRVSLEGCTAAERTCNLATRRDAYLPSERFSNDRFPRNRTCSSNGANHDVLHRAVAVSCRKTAPFAVV